jgi:hypothetical protein
MALFAFAGTSLAVALWYGASPHQRWFTQPLPAFAGHGSAWLSALVALKAWMLALTPMAGFIAWISSTAMLAVFVVYTSKLQPSAKQ